MASFVLHACKTAFAGVRGVAVLVPVLWVFMGGGAAAQDKYGAIYFSTDSGAEGYAYDYDTREGAENRARSECESRSNGAPCAMAAWFSNACGALAVGSDNGFGGDWGNSEREAETKAVAMCGKYAPDCQVRRTICVSR